MITIQEKKIEEIAMKVAKKVFKKMISEERESVVFLELAKKGKSFDFLLDEPDLYFKKDLCKKER